MQKQILFILFILFNILQAQDHENVELVRQIYNWDNAFNVAVTGYPMADETIGIR